jgi:hypothetical protein
LVGVFEGMFLDDPVDATGFVDDTGRGPAEIIMREGAL